MKKILFLFSVLLMIFFYNNVQIKQVYSDDINMNEIDSINQKLNDLQKALDSSIKATTPLEAQVKNLKNQMGDIEAKVSAIEDDIAVKKKNIDDGYKNLSKQQNILNKAIRSYYIKTYSFSPLLVFISTHAAADITRVLAYQKRGQDQDKAIITNTAITITDLENKKKNLENEEKSLASVKIKLDSEKKEIEKIVAGAKEYQTKLTGEISQLTARQQEILAARSGGFIASIGDSELADDYNASIKGFRESAPSGSFSVFSFGAFTHRKGMSQYGARGRAERGENYKSILRAYYGKEPVSKDTGGTINVTGFGALDFEGYYLLGIAEMPSSWNKEALKAQAVAARTYAYRHKTSGGEICTTEACQVFSKSKADNSPDAWRQAVQETRGEVLEDVVTYYSSTTGGYVGSIWDTTDGNGGSGFFDKAYEKIAGSPWFYKAWYTKGYSPSSDKCGRSSPWLSETEMADIINAYFVLYGSGSGADTGRITPTTTSCWPGNPYSYDDLRGVSESYGGGISSVSSVSVIQGNGVTNEVIFQTNKGEKRISGMKFKETFKLRAPGYVWIPQSDFAFFNIEKK